MDHVQQIRALNGLIVHGQFNFLWADVTKIAFGCNGADYRRLFNILCQIPRAALLPKHMIHRSVRRYIVPCLSYKHHKLYLVMIILRTSWIFYLWMSVNDGLWGFCEIKGGFSINRVPHFGGMFCIIATNAKHAVDWKHMSISINSNRRIWRQLVKRWCHDNPHFYIFSYRRLDGI